MQPILRLAIAGFIAGCLAVLIFHQNVWYLLYQIGMIPPERPAWPLERVPPFGVPSVISKAFWGGLWGAALAPFLTRLSGERYWAGLDHHRRGGDQLTSLYVVSAINGEPVPAMWSRLYYALLVNGAWGFGTALFLRLSVAARDT